MEKSFYIVLLPGSLRLRGCVEIGLVGVICHKAHIISAIVISQRCRPHALAVYILLTFQSLSGSTVQLIIHIGEMLPVSQVVRTENLASRHKVHCSTHHVIGISHPYGIGIRIIQPCDRIDGRILGGTHIGISSVRHNFPGLPLKVNHTILLHRQGNLHLAVFRFHPSSLHKRTGRVLQQLAFFCRKIGRFPHVMPYFQWIAVDLIHGFGQKTAFLLLLHLQSQQIFFSGPPVCHIPDHPAVTAVIHAHDHCIVVFQDAMSLSFLQLLEESKTPESRFRDTSVCHQAESSMEGSKGHTLLLKHVSEGPVGVGLVVISQPGQLMCYVSRILIGVMQRRIRYIGGVELRNVNFPSLIFRETVYNLSGSVQIGKAILCLHQLRIAVMPHSLGRLCGIMMSRDKIRRQLVVVAVLQERPDPYFVAASAHRRSAYPKTLIHFLHGQEGPVKQLKVFLHIRMFPESRQIRFVPYLDGPCHHFLPSITSAQMDQQCFYHLSPRFIRGRGCGISLPIEDRLLSAGHLLRHESQLQKRLDSQLQIAVHNSVQIGIIVLCRTVVAYLINGHIVTEQTMTSDVLKADLLLYQLQLFNIFFLQRQPHPAGSHTIVHLIVEFRISFRRQQNPFFFHLNNPAFLFQFRIIPLCPQNAGREFPVA